MNDHTLAQIYISLSNTFTQLTRFRLPSENVSLYNLATLKRVDS